MEIPKQLQPGELTQDLLETIDELGRRLTKVKAKVQAIRAELNQYS